MILGIDVGGTHTDAVLMEGCRVKKKVKVITDENNLINSLLNVTTILFDQEDPEKLTRVVLSTTISTNAIVQNKTDKVGMILSSGPGLPAALLPVNGLTCMLSGYVNHRGIEISRIDPQEVRRASDQLTGNGLKHAGIVCKFSTRNPSQELAILDMVKDSFSSYIAWTYDVRTFELSAAHFYNISE